jgi:hypothetical protein
MVYIAYHRGAEGGYLLATCATAGVAVGIAYLLWVSSGYGPIVGIFALFGLLTVDGLFLPVGAFVVLVIVVAFHAWGRFLRAIAGGE